MNMMKTTPRKDLVGEKFGKLLVTGLSHITPKTYYVYWKCKCECGNEKIVRGDSLKIGAIKTCGCFYKRNNKNVNCSRCGKLLNIINSRFENGKNFYCDRECHRNPKARWVSRDGYYIIVTPRGHLREHRYIMEEKLGRKLLETELVHHINGNKLDNRIDNLEIMSRKDHAIKHKKGVFKTHCLRGHEYTIENTYINPNSLKERDCRKCILIRRNK